MWISWRALNRFGIVGLACLVLPTLVRSQYVVAWGDNTNGQCNVPALPAGLTYVEVAAGGGHTVARRSDGSVVAWGSNFWGECNVPVLPVALTYVEISRGGLALHTVARRSDGSVAAWGWNNAGQCNVPTLPGGLSYVEVAAGTDHTVARYDSVGQPGPPTVTAVSVDRSSLLGGVPLTITGTNFVGPAVARVGGVPIGNQTIVSSTVIAGTTPPLATTQVASVTVTTPYGMSITTGSILYDHAVLIAPATGSLGSPIEIRIASYALKPLIFLVDTAPGPTLLGYLGTAAVGFSPMMIPFLDYFGAFTGVSDPSAVTDSNGQWTTTALVPSDVSLVGVTFYGQAYAFSFFPLPPNQYFFFTNQIATTIVP